MKRTRRGADALFPKVRKQILSALLMSPKRSWFLSDLARHLRTPKTSLQRELANLEGAGIIVRDVQGRQVYYRANPSCPFLPELQGLFAKTAGLVDVIRDSLAKLDGRIQLAFLYGSVAKGEEVTESDVDLMVIGKVGLADLAMPMRAAREQLSRDVYPTVFSLQEFVSKAGEAGFVRTVLDGPKLFIVGSEDVLEKALGTAARGSAEGHTVRDKNAAGNRRSRTRRRRN